MIIFDMLQMMNAGMSNAFESVVKERLRQVHSEGFDDKRDDRYTDWSLSRAATCYLMAITRGNVLPFWPRSWDFRWFKFDSRDPRRALVKAAALIIAEIERIDRREAERMK